jgi:hypothetical protein
MEKYEDTFSELSCYDSVIRDNEGELYAELSASQSKCFSLGQRTIQILEPVSRYDVI